MTEFSVGLAVVVVSENRVRKIVEIKDQQALCETFDRKTRNWFQFSDLRRDDNRPAKLFML